MCIVPRVCGGEQTGLTLVFQLDQFQRNPHDITAKQDSFKIPHPAPLLAWDSHCKVSELQAVGVLELPYVLLQDP